MTGPLTEVWFTVEEKKGRLVEHKYAFFKQQFGSNDHIERPVLHNAEQALAGLLVLARVPTDPYSFRGLVTIALKCSVRFGRC